jgi:hypothetical protein
MYNIGCSFYLLAIAIKKVLEEELRLVLEGEILQFIN